jgi:hypothetical protein
MGNLQDSLRQAVAGINRKHFARFGILVLLPFLTGFWLIPHTAYTNGQLLGAPSENMSGGSSTVSYTFTHSSTDMTLPSRVNAIFPLADYLDFPPFVTHRDPLICFQDTGSYVILPNGTTVSPNFDWDVYFGSSTILDVPKNSVNCTVTKAGESNSYKWQAKLDINLGEQNLTQNMTFVPKTTTYPEFVMDYGLLQGLVLIPVCYLFIWYPAAGIWKKMHMGMIEQ